MPQVHLKDHKPVPVGLTFMKLHGRYTIKFTSEMCVSFNIREMLELKVWIERATYNARVVRKSENEHG